MKCLVAFLTIVLTTHAFAADESTQNLVNRMSCSDIQARISELSKDKVTDVETVSEVVRLKAEYRRNCAKSATGRRTSGAVRVMSDVEIVDNAEEASEPVQTSEETSVANADVVDTKKLTLEQELANLDAGLCTDGSEPNKFGCCPGEVFKDLGDTVFACCPTEGELLDCFPPMK